MADIVEGSENNTDDTSPPLSDRAAEWLVENHGWEPGHPLPDSEAMAQAEIHALADAQPAADERRVTPEGGLLAEMMKAPDFGSGAGAEPEDTGHAAMGAGLPDEGEQPEGVEVGNYEDSEEPNAGGYGSDGRRLNQIGIGTDGKPFYSYGDANAPLKPGLNADPELKAVVDDMMEKSPTFRAMVEKLNKSGDIYKLLSSKQPSDDPARTECEYTHGCTTNIDADKIPLYGYAYDPASQSPQDNAAARMSIQRAIAHEIAHQYDHETRPIWSLLDRDHQRHIGNENAIMKEIDPSSVNRDPNNEKFTPGRFR